MNQLKMVSLLAMMMITLGGCGIAQLFNPNAGLDPAMEEEIRQLIRDTVAAYHKPIDQTKTAEWYRDRRASIQQYLVQADGIWLVFKIAIGAKNIPPKLQDAWTEARGYITEALAELDRLLIVRAVVDADILLMEPEATLFNLKEPE